MTASYRSLPERIPVAVLGATGTVGQAIVRLLVDHPWFALTEVAASERSAGRPYGNVARWQEGTLPPSAGALPVRRCSPDEVTARLVFSAVDADIATNIEAAFANDGRVVVSNARSYRLEPDVPLVIPEVNPDHLGLLSIQRQRRGWTGGVVTNPNCATAIIALALAPLHEAFDLRRLFVTTLQAVSGAGYPGVASLDILGNVIPFIPGEEEKIEHESRKLLGVWDGDLVRPATFAVSAHATRVPVHHGHTACLSVAFDRPVSVAEAREAIGGWKSPVEDLRLPSAPARPLKLTEAMHGPEPRRDSPAGGGMTVTIGRLREDPQFHLRLVATGHNVIRGAAGAAVLNAELLAAQGLVPPSFRTRLSNGKLVQPAPATPGPCSNPCVL